MRVSIVICNYNYARFLDEAIRSALGQTHPDVEVVVVDDGSTDDSSSVIARWADRVVAVYKTNAGQISAYNAGFARTTGEIVMFLDADDYLDQTACAEVVARFTYDVVKVHFRMRLVDAEGTALGGTIPRNLSRGDVSHLLREGKLYQSAPGSGNAYRRSALARLMPLVSDPLDLHGADFFAVYGISLLGRVESCEAEALGGYRIQSDATRRRVTFGNAVRRSPEPARALRRYGRLSRLVQERLGPGYAIAPDFADFSVDKLGFAAAIFDAPSYLGGVRAGALYLRRRMYRAIRARPGSRATQVGLVGWSVAVLLLPRRLGLPIARYVCNPSSR